MVARGDLGVCDNTLQPVSNPYPAPCSPPMLKCQTMPRALRCHHYPADWMAVNCTTAVRNGSADASTGAQIPIEDVPSVQKEVVMRCRQMGKPVIVASHLLQSMIEYPTPTRAEVRLGASAPGMARLGPHVPEPGAVWRVARTVSTHPLHLYASVRAL